MSKYSVQERNCEGRYKTDDGRWATLTDCGPSDEKFCGLCKRCFYERRVVCEKQHAHLATE